MGCTHSKIYKVSSLHKMLKDHILFVCGLATDYCVKYSSIDAYNEGFKTKVLCSCVRGISVQTTEIAFKEMKDMGISII